MCVLSIALVPPVQDVKEWNHFVTCKPPECYRGACLRLPGGGQDQEDVWEVFEAIFGCGYGALLDADAARQNWGSACRRIIRATRRAEQLLQPLVSVEAFPADSDVFTHPTAPSHSQVPPATSFTAETQTQGEVEASNPLEESSGGANETEMQELEHELLELQVERGGRDYPHIAFVHFALANVNLQAGDHLQAKQQLEESLEMLRSLHVDRDHPDIAGVLYALGQANLQACNNNQAKQQLEESLRMFRSWHGARAHPHIARVLWALGRINRQAGDDDQASQQLEEALRIASAHPDIAGRFLTLGQVNLQAGVDD